jgi:excisionase family DNA binding protein
MATRAQRRVTPVDLAHDGTVSEQLEFDLRRLAPPTKPQQKRPADSSAAALGPRLALSPDEAAAVLGVSRDYFDEHILPELRIVRRGRRILIPLAELERWLDRSAVCSTMAA